MNDRNATHGWDTYSPTTKNLAVVRWGRYFYVLDKETNSTIGPPFPSKWEAVEYAQHRQATTYTR